MPLTSLTTSFEIKIIKRRRGCVLNQVSALLRIGFNLLETYPDTSICGIF